MRHKLTTFILKNPPEQVGLHTARIQLLVHHWFILTMLCCRFYKVASLPFRTLKIVLIYFIFFSIYLLNLLCLFHKDVSLPRYDLAPNEIVYAFDACFVDVVRK